MPWRRWGPYLSERQWGTVREDYSADGDAWNYFSHDQARSRAYRWGEDGIGGLSDDRQRLCFALALWNGARPDPQGAVLRPDQLGGQPRRGRQGVLLLPRRHADPLLHADALQVPAARLPLRRSRRDERARSADGDGVRAARHRRLRRRPLLRRLRRVRQGRARRPAHAGHGPQPRPGRRRRCMCCRRVVPQHLGGRPESRPRLHADGPGAHPAERAASSANGSVHVVRPRRASCCSATTRPTPPALAAARTATAFVKDGINDYVVHGRCRRVNPDAGRHQGRRAPPADGARRWRGRVDFRLRLGRRARGDGGAARAGFDAVSSSVAPKPTTSTRRSRPPALTTDDALVMRQALAGMLWTKQYYDYDVDTWLERARRRIRCARQSPRSRATRSGSTCGTPTSSPCRTAGSTPGTPRGTSPSTASR